MSIEGQAVAVRGRAGTWLLLVGGLALAAIMGFSLTLDRPFDRARQVRAAEVAVVLPSGEDWNDFHEGVALADRRGLIRLVREDPGAILVETPGRRLPLRFVWHRARGGVETRAAVRQLLGRAVVPLAVVGSSNTVLTIELAEALRAGGTGAAGPLLLVPWATSVWAGAGAGGAGQDTGTQPLLAILAGRTFRFCPDNRREADLVVRCLAEQTHGKPPAQVVVVTDQDDRYSVDLAACFRGAIATYAPAANIVEQTEAIASPGFGPTPSRSETRTAAEIWRAVRESPAGRPTWAVVPLQADPARRLLAALKRQARPADRSDGRTLHVVCGDGVGLEVLYEFAGVEAFSIWCASPASAPQNGLGAVHNAHVPAEIVTALALALDRSDGTSRLADALVGLNVTPDHPAALGRSLDFEASGERRGEDLGHVLAVRAGRDDVVAYATDAEGKWGRPVPVPPPAILAQP